MPMTFTPKQQKVIDLRNCNILVSAAAGSGKTAVLVERIVKMVCDETRPVDIDRLLVVTFTNAAAAEMRERIAAGIAARLALQPDSGHIQRQAALLHNAQITTIDSFCLFLLRNHFGEIGLDPAFRIADEGEIRLMQQEVLQETLEEAYAEGREGFLRCVEYFCPEGNEMGSGSLMNGALERHILKLSGYSSAFPWPEEWLEARRADYECADVEALCGSDYGRYLTGHLKAMAQGWAQKLEKAYRLCLEPDGPYMYGELMEKELEEVGKLAECGSLADYALRLPAVQFGRLSSKKDESVSAIKREHAANLRAQVKKSLQGMAERFFATPLELAVRQSSGCLEPVGELIDLTLRFRAKMAERKQEKKIVDFSDLEHFALDILLEREDGRKKPSQVALEYRQHFAEILIDEYQDSNLVQEIILSAVSGEEEGRFNRFMVGDVKQSIYKFRLARPELFLEKYHAYTAAGGALIGEASVGETPVDETPVDETPVGEEPVGGSSVDRHLPVRAQETPPAHRQRIDLSKNFRSRPQVLEAVNDVFSRVMSRQTGGLAYDDEAALYPGASYPERKEMEDESEFLLVEKPSAENEEAFHPPMDLNARQAEARAIAAKIRELRSGFSVTDRTGGGLRPAKYSDMVILLRATSGWDEEFKAVLEEEGIPVYITSKTGYFAATEVQTLLQLLRVLDNPRQDIPLFGVMKSVFGEFTEEEIALIRSADRRGSRKEGVYASLYEAVEGFAAGNEAGGAAGNEAAEGSVEPDKAEEHAALRGRAADFLRMIEEYRRCTVYMPVRELLTKLLADFDYLNYVTALPAGGKRRANVEMLLTKASDFEKTSYFGLFHFVRYMEQLEKYDVDYGEAELLDENADVVRIMSIHKSKGLEFPITFVSGLGKRFNMQDVNQSLILDMDLGLATDYINPGKRVRNKTLRRNVLARKLREESLSEELRVLYVAMTRAREKLILTASMENAQESWELLKENANENLLYPDFIESASFLDFLLPVLGGTCVRVTVIRPEDLAAGGLREAFELCGREERLDQAQDFADRGEVEKLWQRLRESYPFENLAGLYTKTTVSELKIAAMADRDEEAYHAFEENEVQPYIPAFRRQAEKVSGAVRGNAYHRVMELLDIGRVLSASVPGESKEAACGSRSGTSAESFADYEAYRAAFHPAHAAEAFRAFRQEEVESGRLKREYAEAVDEKKILRFLESELAYRMWRAGERGRLYREQPFVMGISAAKLGQDFPESESVLIQGIIDVFFEEEDGIVLLDYKTDAVSAAGELRNRYETQLDYYSQAIRKLTGKPVKERILYSFHLGTAVRADGMGAD